MESDNIGFDRQVLFPPIKLRDFYFFFKFSLKNDFSPF